MVLSVSAETRSLRTHLNKYMYAADVFFRIVFIWFAFGSCQLRHGAMCLFQTPRIPQSRLTHRCVHLGFATATAAAQNWGVVRHCGFI